MVVVHTMVSVAAVNVQVDVRVAVPDAARRVPAGAALLLKQLAGSLMLTARSLTRIVCVVKVAVVTVVVACSAFEHPNHHHNCFRRYWLRSIHGHADWFDSEQHRSSCRRFFIINGSTIRNPTSTQVLWVARSPVLRLR